MKQKTIEDILGDFSANEQADAPAVDRRAPVTVWLSPEYKKKYDELQKGSNRQLSKAARKMMMALIDTAKARAS